MISVKLSDVICPHFYNAHNAIKNHDYVHFRLKGGRGSTKSSFVSLEVPLLMLKNENYNAVVFRKVSNTLRDSVYAQYMWALEMLGIRHKFTCRVSPMEMIYNPTGQKILFRGSDDKSKIKSIKVSKGYIAITHFEELDQFAGNAEIRSILQSTMRGGDKFWNFESFNPPISKSNWANADSEINRSDRIVHSSNYLNVPKDWLGEQFFHEADMLKQIDERAYRHEYLGEAVGTGGNVFENVEERIITDEEISHFDNIYQGQDWGWYPHPSAFVRVYLNKNKREIIFIDELGGNKINNKAFADMIKSKKYYDYPITCDSAENKSISDYRECGLNAMPAIKGPGSIDYGMKWLQGYKLIFDKRRTPMTYKQFVEYEYERNKNGEIISGYPDEKDDFIDATRYALEPVSRRRWNLA